MRIMCHSYLMFFQAHTNFFWTSNTFYATSFAFYFISCLFFLYFFFFCFSQVRLFPQLSNEGNEARNFSSVLLCVSVLPFFSILMLCKQCFESNSYYILLWFCYCCYTLPPVDLRVFFCFIFCFLFSQSAFYLDWVSLAIKAITMIALYLTHKP